MSFYTSAVFFIALSIAIIIAACIGLSGRSLKRYGLVASIVFLILMFSSSWQQLGAFLIFLCVAGISTKAVLHIFTKPKESACAEESKTHAKAQIKTNKSRNIIVYRCFLVLTLAPLAIYKISAVFDGNLLGFIGISYVTFKALQVLIEIRDGLIKELSFFDWLSFIIFFATITSGPIDRSRRFLEDTHAKQERNSYADLLSRGILLILLGAIYQLVIATILHSYISFQPFYEQKGVLYNLLSAGKDGWLYGLYLFFDFAGYSMMACGVSYCFGIRCPRNFKAPFASIDIKDFWNRWHITLSFWLRDFVFMRFVTALTKRKIFKTRLTRACSGYVVNMTLMGCWHGLTPEYILYGFYHGVLLAATDVFQKKSSFYKKHKNKTWFKLCSWAITLNLVMIGFAIFSGQLTTFIGGIFA